MHLWSWERFWLASPGVHLTYVATSQHGKTTDPIKLLLSTLTPPERKHMFLFWYFPTGSLSHKLENEDPDLHCRVYYCSCYICSPLSPTEVVCEKNETFTGTELWNYIQNEIRKKRERAPHIGISQSNHCSE